MHVACLLISKRHLILLIMKSCLRNFSTMEYRGTALSFLFRSYLTDRQQFVSLGGVNSASKVIKHGVPHGSEVERERCIFIVASLTNLQGYTLSIVSRRGHGLIKWKALEYLTLLFE